MLARGTAYRCWATPEEIEAFRAQAKAEGRPPLFRSPWRDADPATAPDAPFVVRLKAPREGETVVDDVVQGRVTWKNETLDDLVLLRSDGTPTYMLAVVVDDHDMGVTHVIRGDDHLTNTARQTLIYRAADWETPAFAHIPLIHGADGAKLSKRHGALGVEAYREMGYPAEAMRNYLARLGWSHGNDEFFTTPQAIEWFDLTHLGKAPARFDFAKLESLSGQHIRAMNDAALLSEVEDFLAVQNRPPLTQTGREQMLAAMPGLKERARTIPQILDMASFILGRRPFAPDAAGAKALAGAPAGMLEKLTSRLRNASWTTDDLEAAVRDFAAAEGVGLGKVAQPLRVALSGRTVSLGVFDMMRILGRDETLARLEDCAGKVTSVA
jgi:glutamyl-tRNA synthetase